MALRQIRVLIVDDSRSARALIRSLIETAPDLSVCGEAGNGREAVELAMSLAPDIITMDLQMPEMDGMQAIEQIMSRRAVPILVLSDVADAHNAMAAVARGALEAARKPAYDEAVGLVARLRILASVPVIRHIRCADGSPAAPPAQPKVNPIPTRANPAGPRSQPTLVAIAASTGGPQALSSILAALPADFPTPLLIAQHISDGFAEAMAGWLNELSALSVSLAREGETPKPGHAYLADSTTHMTLAAGQRIRLLARAESDIYRPSCDQLLLSVASQMGAACIGVILTGMGKDGAKGLLGIRQAGGTTIAQNEASSVIFGMNKEAISAGGAQLILPLEAIPGELCALTGAGSGAGRGMPR